MNRFYTANVVRQSLAGHSWIGLLVGGAMYLICLSGTLVVFYEELERWEQPRAEEYRDYDADLIQRAYENFFAANFQETEHLYVVFPLPGNPRIVVENDHEAWFVNRDGSLGARQNPSLTNMLVNLHLYLHLPRTLGLILVSAAGALLCGLILSGFFAHPRILRDAFSLRLGGNRQLAQTEIHNRLSVWGAPFHLIIALTGAYFGLASIIAFVVASAFYGGDENAVLEEVFGAEPELRQEIRPVNIRSALNQLERLAPEAEPIFLTIHEPRTPGQFLEIYAKLPGRLIYSENFRFDANGRYLGYAGFSDGPLGKQIVYSTYRLHFGHFGTVWVKLLYFVLGLSLTVVSVTGVNIWLERRKQRDYINDLWTGFVWGTPLALGVAAVSQILLGIPGTAMFWLTLISSTAFAAFTANRTRSRCILQASCAAAFSVLLVGYSLIFRGDTLAPAALAVNCMLLLSGAVLVFAAMRR